MELDIAGLLAQTDGADPLVIILTWALVALVKKFASKKFPKIRHILPVVAVLLAIALRGGAEAVQGMPLSWETVQHGLGAAGLAVLLHSQLREGKKAQNAAAAKREAAAEAKADSGAVPMHTEDRPEPTGGTVLHRPKDTEGDNGLS